MASTYAELLQHPNWQRKRLEVLEAKDFTCEYCGEDDKTLHVHHTYYEKGKKPWEYPDTSYRVYCAECHIRAEAILTRLKRQMGRIANVEQLLGYALGLEALDNDHLDVPVDSYEVAQGIADAFHMNTDQVIDEQTHGHIPASVLHVLQHSRRRT